MDITAEIENDVHARTSICELCAASDKLKVHPVQGGGNEGAECCILACQTCIAQIEGSEPLNPKHWFVLKDSMWSELSAVAVSSFRMLKKLRSESWAQELLEQMYLSEESQEWADNEVKVDEADTDEEVQTLDSNGAVLAEGDSVTLIQDLPVKGAGFTAKRGTLVKSIHLIGDPDNIEGRINKMTLVLKTKFLKKGN